MNKIYCLLTRKFLPPDISYIQSRLDKRIELIIPDSYDDGSMIKILNEKNVEVIIGTIPSEKVLSNAGYLKMIQVPWTGLDNINLTDINKEAVKEITICNSHSNAKPVAELAISLMFASIKWIPLYDKSLRTNDWRRPGGKSKYYAPELLCGKNIGIIGFGHIGFEISKMLKGFGVNISAINKSGKDKFDSGVKVADMTRMNKIISESDIIFLTLPLTEKTKNLIGKDEFLLMRKGCYLVNVSRGEIVNEEDLYNALKNGKIAGAAIDTWYCYPQRGNSETMPSKFNFGELDNVVLSPHRGGFVKDALPHLDDVILNVNNYADGKPLINKVNISESY